MSECLQIAQSIDGIGPNEIRCIFTCEEKMYMLMTDSYDMDFIASVKWNPYQGFQCLDEDVPSKVISFAQSILRRHWLDDERYPLVGEWYEIRPFALQGKTQWRIRRTKGRGKTRRLFVAACMIQYLLALTVSAFVFAWHSGEAAKWLYSVLPYFDLLTLKIVILIFQFAGITLLFCWFDRSRDLFNLFFDAYLPIGVIMIAGLLKCFWWMCIVLPIGLGIAILLARVYMGTYEDGSPVGLRLDGEHIRVALIVFLIMTVTFTSLTGLHGYANAGTPTDIPNMTNEDAERLYLSTCDRLASEEWGRLTSREKLDVLQIICDYECRTVLGCEAVRVRSGLTDTENTLGEYSDEVRSFVIREEHLQSSTAEEVLRTALHETRHAYQHSLVEMYRSLEEHIRDEDKNLLPFMQAKVFADEFENYYSGEEDYQRYYTQEVERDCRDWANTRLIEQYMDYLYPEQ